MYLYESRDGIIFNLNKFVSFQVLNDNVEGPGADKSMWSLVAQTESGTEFVLYLGDHAQAEEECKDELMRVQAILNQLTMVALTQQPLNKLN